MKHHVLCSLPKPVPDLDSQIKNCVVCVESLDDQQIELAQWNKRGRDFVSVGGPFD